MTIRFSGMFGPHGFLSRFYPCTLTIGDRVYQSCEHWYQACKTTDPGAHEHIRTAESAADACLRGRACTYRSDWEKVVGTPALAAKFMDERGCVVELTKDHFMYTGLVLKFQIPELKEKLLATGDHELIKMSDSDDYWGEAQGYGKNKLGRMLQLVRRGLS